MNDIALDAWALNELTGHYVNYRKSLADTGSKKLPPEEDFQLYAVATRYPEKLAKQLALQEVSQGVYEVQCCTLDIRLIVSSKVPDTDANAVWAMFSDNDRRVLDGEARYGWHDPDKRTIVTDGLYEKYRKEGMKMAYTAEDFLRHYRESWFEDLSPEERLKGLPPEERLKGLPPEERLKVIPPELLKALPEETIKSWLSRQEMETKQ